MGVILCVFFIACIVIKISAIRYEFDEQYQAFCCHHLNVRQTQIKLIACNRGEDDAIRLDYHTILCMYEVDILISKNQALQ